MLKPLIDAGLPRGALTAPQLAYRPSPSASTGLAHSDRALPAALSAEGDPELISQDQLDRCRRVGAGLEQAQQTQAAHAGSGYASIPAFFSCSASPSAPLR